MPKIIFTKKGYKYIQHINGIPKKRNIWIGERYGQQYDSDSSIKYYFVSFPLKDGFYFKMPIPEDWFEVVEEKKDKIINRTQTNKKSIVCPGCGYNKNDTECPCWDFC